MLAILAYLLKSFGGTIISEFLKSAERYFNEQSALNTREALGKEEAVNEVNAAATTQKAAIEAKAGVETDQAKVIDALDKGTF